MKFIHYVNDGPEYGDQPHRCCMGKIKHPSRKLARRHARTLGNRMHVYRCWACGGFHIGHHQTKENKNEAV